MPQGPCSKWCERERSGHRCLQPVQVLPRHAHPSHFLSWWQSWAQSAGVWISVPQPEPTYGGPEPCCRPSLQPAQLSQSLHCAWRPASGRDLPPSLLARLFLPWSQVVSMVRGPPLIMLGSAWASLWSGGWGWGGYSLCIKLKQLKPSRRSQVCPLTEPEKARAGTACGVAVQVTPLQGGVRAGQQYRGRACICHCPKMARKARLRQRGRVPLNFFFFNL